MAFAVMPFQSNRCAFDILRSGDVKMKRLALIVALIQISTISCTATPTPTSVPTVTPQVAVTTRVVSATPQGITVTATPEPTNTPTRTTTSTPSPTFTLSGIVFFDRNGNGIQDPGEFPIGTVEVAVQDTGGKEQIVKTTCPRPKSLTVIAPVWAE
jgi:hypothetical protein